MSTSPFLGFQQDPTIGGPDPDGAVAATLPELSRVRLVDPVRVGNDELPAGSRGTIVHAYRANRAYEVEFTSPIQTLLTLSADQVRPSRD